MRPNIILTLVVFFAVERSSFADPVGWWPADNGGVSASLAPDAILSNVSTDIGKISNAWHFDGLTSTGRIPDSTLLRSPSFGIAFWVKFDSLSSSQTPPSELQYIIFQRGNGDFESYSICKLRNPTDQFVLTLGRPFTGRIGIGSNIPGGIQTNRWYYIAATFDNTNARLFVDGVLAETAATGFDIGYRNESDTYIGTSGQNFDGRFCGLLDDLRFYDSTNIPTIPNVTSTNYTIDPRSTFLRTSSDGNARAPTVIKLSDAHIYPGDYVFMERFGKFAFSPAESTEEGNTMLATFSSSNIVTESSNLVRVPGAIQCNGQPISTAATFHDSLPTDIGYDFISNRTLVQVPATATHLIIGTHDVYYGDNEDRNSPPDFQQMIVRIQNPSLDSDDDGSSDLAEFLAGTDYNDPSSHIHLNLAPAPSPGQLRIQWTAQPYRWYELQSSDNLSSWLTFETIPALNSTVVTQRDFQITSPKQFYRLFVGGLTTD